MAEEHAAASFTPTLEPGDTPPWREPVAHHVLYHSMGQYVDRLIERICDLEKKVAEMELVAKEKEEKEAAKAIQEQRQKELSKSSVKSKNSKPGSSNKLRDRYIEGGRSEAVKWGEVYRR